LKSKTIKGKNPDEIKNTLAESIADDFAPTLAIVFISIKQDIDAVCKLLDNHGIQIFGATSSGEFISSEIEEESIVIMLLDMDPHYFRLVFLETNEIVWIGDKKIKKYVTN